MAVDVIACQGITWPVSNQCSTQQADTKPYSSSNMLCPCVCVCVCVGTWLFSKCIASIEWVSVNSFNQSVSEEWPEWDRHVYPHSLMNHTGTGHMWNYNSMEYLLGGRPQSINLSTFICIREVTPMNAFYLAFFHSLVPNPCIHMIKCPRVVALEFPTVNSVW